VLLADHNLSEQNRNTTLRWFEQIWNQRNPEVIEELLPEDCVLHDGMVDMRGPKAFRSFHDNIRATFSDVHVEPGQLIADGDLVCLHWTAHLLHTATGASLKTTGISMIRFREGRFEECWQNWDEIGLVRQIETAARAGAQSAA
jgi:predicted SnoaL-like aldol condensation-catalyzing enzyme